jgi:lipopolysaccharide/colanic/teichoic acid biosynthesis glycosyltransferase
LHRSQEAIKQEYAVNLHVLLPEQIQTISRIREDQKRCFDLVISLACLLVFAPIMVIIAVLVKLTSPGSIFYRQERVTKDGKIFYICKFRTMQKNAEAHTGPIWVIHNDYRITPFGKFLRNTHLDELPQLWNVLVGDMSFIGPRPERPVFVQQFIKEGVSRYSDRHLAKAGITGYAQNPGQNTG